MPGWGQQASKGEIPTWKSVLLQELLLGEDFHSLEEEEKAVLKPAESPNTRCCEAGAGSARLRAGGSWLETATTGTPCHRPSEMEQTAAPLSFSHGKNNWV